MSDSLSNGHIDDLDFSSLRPVELPVKYGGRSYILRDASADAGCRYKDAMLRASTTKTGADGKIEVVSMDRMHETEIVLVAGCLFLVADDKAEFHPPNPVPEVELRTWPYGVVSKLFDRAKAISPGLSDADAGERAKNSPAGATDSSG